VHLPEQASFDVAEEACRRMRRRLLHLDAAATADFSHVGNGSGELGDLDRANESRHGIAFPLAAFAAHETLLDRLNLIARSERRVPRA